MSVHDRSLSGVILYSLLALLPLGCAPLPTGSQAVFPDEDEDFEARTLRTTMMKNRARLEPKGGIVFPMNSQFETGWGGGIKGQIEAVEKGMWFGLEFDYARIDTKDPLLRGSPQNVFLAADTEEKMESFDRYQVLLTWDYEIPTGPALYYPLFRFGIGLGGVAINAQEAPGNPFQDFDHAYMFVAQPSVSFRFPFHENVAAFLEAEYNYIPKIQMTGDDRLSDRNVDIGSKVEFSSVNVWGGLSLEW